MENTNHSIFSNILIFIGGVCGSYNFWIAIRNFRYGTKYEEVLKENADLKRELHELKNEIIGKDVIIAAHINKQKENDRRTKK